VPGGGVPSHAAALAQLPPPLGVARRGEEHRGGKPRSENLGITWTQKTYENI